jgi:hypothetical protein
MKIVAISRVLDEADIVEAFVRHTAPYVDHHVLMDNGSQDGTLEILSSLQQEGLPLSVFQNKCVSWNEANHLTFLFRHAVASHAADWVTCLDVDEFLDDRRTIAGLADMLENLAPEVSCLKLPVVEYIATSEDAVDENTVPIRIRKRREPADNFKVLVRGGLTGIDTGIQDGSHGIKQGDHAGTTITQHDLRLAHYSERSPFQYIAKFVRGWSRVLAAGAAVTASGAAEHYMNPYEVLRSRPAEFLRNGRFMGFKNETPDLIDDPITYSGGCLRYTPNHDEAMRAVRSLMGTMHALALRHGALLDAFPDVKQQVAEWDSQFSRIL